MEAQPLSSIATAVSTADFRMVVLATRPATCAPDAGCCHRRDGDSVTHANCSPKAVNGVALRARYFLSRQPVVSIHQVVARHASMNTSVIPKLMPTRTSAIS